MSTFGNSSNPKPSALCEIQAVNSTLWENSRHGLRWDVMPLGIFQQSLNSSCCKFGKYCLTLCFSFTYHASCNDKWRYSSYSILSFFSHFCYVCICAWKLIVTLSMEHTYINHCNRINYTCCATLHMSVCYVYAGIDEELQLPDCFSNY